MSTGKHFNGITHEDDALLSYEDFERHLHRFYERTDPENYRDRFRNQFVEITEETKTPGPPDGLEFLHKDYHEPKEAPAPSESPEPDPKDDRSQTGGDIDE